MNDILKFSEKDKQYKKSYNFNNILCLFALEYLMEHQEGKTSDITSAFMKHSGMTGFDELNKRFEFILTYNSQIFGEC